MKKVFLMVLLSSGTTTFAMNSGDKQGALIPKRKTKQRRHNTPSRYRGCSCWKCCLSMFAITHGHAIHFYRNRSKEK